MRTALGDGIVALAGVIGTVGGDADDLPVLRDPAEQVRQHRRIADMACGDLDGADFQRSLVDPEVDLAPDAPFGAAVLAGMPLAFAPTLMPVLSIGRCSRSREPRWGMFAGTVFRRRDDVLKPGIARSSPISCSRPRAIPVV